MSNIMKLAIIKASRDAIPDGGGLQSGIEFFTNPEKLKSTMKAAEEWAKLAVKAVREADEPNPYKNADDETIAGEILRQLNERMTK